MRYHFTLTGMVLTKKKKKNTQKIANIGKNVEKPALRVGI